MPDTKISAGADPGTLLATDKSPIARSGSTTAYAATMAEFASYANGVYAPNYFTGTPSMDSTGAPGTAAFVSRGDHVHPSDTTRVAKAGDTMTGPLTLSGAPTANLHAATKLYVDGSAPVGGPYLPLAGGTLTGAVTPAQVAGLVGTTTNNNAAAGSVGEFLNVNTAPSVAVSTGGSPTTIATLSLTAGDWDVWGNVALNPASVPGYLSASIGFSSGALAAPGPNATNITVGGGAAGLGNTFALAPFRASVAATTLVYLNGIASGASSATGYGTISARRAR